MLIQVYILSITSELGFFFFWKTVKKIIELLHILQFNNAWYEVALTDTVTMYLVIYNVASFLGVTRCVFSAMSVVL